MRLMSIIFFCLIALSVAVLPVSSFGSGHLASAHSHQVTPDHSGVEHSRSHTDSSHLHAPGAEAAIELSSAPNAGSDGTRSSTSACCEIGVCHAVVIFAVSTLLAVDTHAAKSLLPIEHQAESLTAARIERPPRAV